MKSQGISLTEARARISRESDIAALYNDLLSSLGEDRIAPLWVDHDNVGRVNVGVVEGTSAASIISRSKVGDLVDQRTIRHTIADARRMAFATRDALDKLGIPGSYYLISSDVRHDQVVLRVAAAFLTPSDLEQVLNYARAHQLTVDQTMTPMVAGVAPSATAEAKTSFSN